MDGIHDLGGMQGFGPVEREANEPVFHAPWEAEVLAIMRAGGSRGLYNIDEFRHGIERMDPAHYLQAGDAVVTRNVHPHGHTRLPRYVRGKRGVIHRLHGIHVYPDTNAHGQGEQPQPLYSVRFEGRELWGESAEPNEQVHVDCWESYLLPGR